MKTSENIWGGGESCHVTHFKTMAQCPANALWAINTGEYAGKNIVISIEKQPLKRLNQKGLKRVAKSRIRKE